VVGLLIGAAVLMLVVKHPTDAAEWVHGAGQLAGDAIDGISTFLRVVLR
jgi:hypothetical protein